MKTDRVLTRVLAAAAIVALLAVGSAAYTVAGSALDAEWIAIVADGGALLPARTTQ